MNNRSTNPLEANRIESGEEIDICPCRPIPKHPTDSLGIRESRWIFIRKELLRLGNGCEAVVQSICFQVQITFERRVVKVVQNILKPDSKSLVLKFSQGQFLGVKFGENLFRNPRNGDINVGNSIPLRRDLQRPLRSRNRLNLSAFLSITFFGSAAHPECDAQAKHQDQQVEENIGRSMPHITISSVAS